jgi:protein O-mannosyl-transferase
VLVAATVLAYQPVWHAGFIWDDDYYVTGNKLLTAPDGLKQIWFSRQSPSQYFPLVYTTFRIEHSLWGLDPAGYHWVNLLLHAVNAVLVWRLLQRLGAPGAWLAAALFALHPVQVESVAWITERKNVLSLFFSLLAVWAWISFVHQPRFRLWPGYALALMFYALALLSKSTACTLPAALVLVLWLKGKPINRSRLIQVLPFVTLGLGMGLLAMWWERYHQGTQGMLFALDPLERLLVASRALWFYAGKLVWPVHLTFSYPRWIIDPRDPLAYRWLVGELAACVVIYSVRRHIGRGVPAAILFYVVTLSPLLGFIMLYTFVYSFVADHYQYAASIGPLSLAAAGISLARTRWERSRALLSAGVGAGLLLLGVLTCRQSAMYGNIETLWRTTLRHNPNSYLAESNLGRELLLKGQMDEAVQHIRRAIEIQPDLPEAHCNLGTAWLQQGRLDEAIVELRKAVEINPRFAEAHNTLGVALAQQGEIGEAISHLQKAVGISPDFAQAHSNLGAVLLKARRMEEAIDHFQKTLELQPNLADAWDNLRRLAWTLATSPDASLRNGPRAIDLAQRANQAAGAKDPRTMAALAAAYAEARRFPEALAAAQQALGLATNQGNIPLADALQAQIELYRGGLPIREP